MKIESRVIEVGLALSITIGIFAGVYFGYSYLTREETIDVVETPSGEYDPPDTVVVDFLKAAGNIGNADSVEIEQLENGYLFRTNGARRIESFDKAKGALDTSTYLSGESLRDSGFNYANATPWPVFYTLDEKSIKINSVDTSKDELKETALVNVSFVSNEIVYRLKATDSSSDGTYQRAERVRKVDEVLIELVLAPAQGGWKISKVRNIDEVGPRLSIWDPEEGMVGESGEIVVTQELPPKKK